MTNLEIAQTIVDQIKCIDRMAFVAWGTRQLQAIDSGLMFKVGGLAKFKGWVRVKYNSVPDLYSIEFLKSKNGVFVVVKTDIDVYAEDLVNIIDMTVQ